eukprot:jgi/Botrbrau1/8149/Bobra.0308s0037.1
MDHQPRYHPHFGKYVLYSPPPLLSCIYRGWSKKFILPGTQSSFPLPLPFGLHFPWNSDTSLGPVNLLKGLFGRMYIRPNKSVNSHHLLLRQSLRGTAHIYPSKLLTSRLHNQPDIYSSI